MFLSLNQQFDILIGESRMRAKIDDDATRSSERQKLLDFYRGDQTKSSSYLLDLITSKAERKLWIQNKLRTVNFTQKVIKQKCKTYRTTPDVQIWDGENLNESASKDYNNLLKQCKADTIRKEIERHTKLLGRTAVLVAEDDKEPSRMRIELISDFVPYYIENTYDIYKPDAIVYPISLYKDKSNNFIQINMAWTSTSYCFVDNSLKFVDFEWNGNVISGWAPHGYDRMPIFFPYSSLPTNSFWVPMATNVVSNNQILNIQKTVQLDRYLYQAYKQLTAYGLSEDEVKKINLGHDEIIATNSRRQDAEFGFLDLNDDALDQKVMYFQNTYDQALDEENLTSKYAKPDSRSGISIQIEASDEIEDRADLQSFMRDSLEVPLYDTIQMVGQRLGYNFPKRDGQTRIEVIFGDLGYPEPEEKKILKAKAMLEAGLWTRAKALSYMTGQTEKDAQKTIDEVDNDKRMSTDAGSPFRLSIEGDNVQTQ